MTAKANRGGLTATHNRWHKRRVQRSATCPLCTPGAPWPLIHRPKHQITLTENDVAALRQFVDRTTAMVEFVRELLGAL